MSALFTSIKENLSFIGVCLLVFAALLAVALIYERFAMRSRRKLGAAKTVSFVAMFSAVASMLQLFEIPLFFSPGFYKLDLVELPVLICSFYLGPVSGVVCELVKNMLKLLLKGSTTMFVGDFANFAVGCSFVLPASMIYHRIKTKKGAIFAMVTGTLTLTVFGSLFNAWYLLPKFAQLYGMPMDALVAMGTQVNGAITSVWTLVAFAVVPFNLLKGVVVSLLTFLLYKRIERLLLSKAV